MWLFLFAFVFFSDLSFCSFVFLFCHFVLLFLFKCHLLTWISWIIDINIMMINTEAGGWSNIITSGLQRIKWEFTFHTKGNFTGFVFKRFSFLWCSDNNVFQLRPHLVWFFRTDSTSWYFLIRIWCCNEYPVLFLPFIFTCSHNISIMSYLYTGYAHTLRPGYGQLTT